MEVLASETGTKLLTIIERTDRIIEDTCKSYYSDKEKLIFNLKKDKKNLSMTVNSFLLKQKLQGLTDSEMDIFSIIKALK